MNSLTTYFLAAVIVVGGFTLSGSTADAQSVRRDYWNNYWGWYDRQYTPYYRQYRPNRSYYSTPRYNYYRGNPYDSRFYNQPRYGTNIGPLYFEWR